ncbi:DNA (cytosine-5)-methyltransferase 1 [Limnobacter thiooxidans]|uniref:DNA (cytosine-5-)-methyltransferase n=1 Tax=Limnobacter thiooxidans TaxID=131080 RepID=A0AA86J100_9BURK|nr:DNA (cytosine-5)-methyltransferase 1 [Limnobacter thiooxidans]BET27619.1 DNA cytosine methyltransferase [Limnobacter thiooxidans]
MTLRKPILVIDLFAGPGGLGEGFSSILDSAGSPRFSLKLSAEKDPIAHKTLSLRSLYRKFSPGKVPDCYYEHIRGEISRDELFGHPDTEEAAREALEEARNFELGKDNPEDLDFRIRTALAGADDWVLIGGPPCQAYSVAGRSRRTRESLEKFESDEKHFLYKEYLRIIRAHKPAVFIMENVKGMLSSKHGGTSIFEKIVADLSKPGDDLEYQIHSFVKPGVAGEIAPHDFVIAAERFGVPQGRHRVILFGIRSDVARSVPAITCSPEKFILNAEQAHVTVGQTLSDLPKLRSKLSKETDGHQQWLSALAETQDKIQFYRSDYIEPVFREIGLAVKEARHHASTGGNFLRYELSDNQLQNGLKEWFSDARLGGVIQHDTRSHMRSDLNRYMFTAAYGKVHKYSPKIADFPRPLLPNHGNVSSIKVPFVDRFRVQLADSWSSTVVSHIAKDGHYFIHPDPSQCRSLTVREAARLQTFPDNYFFAGNRTEQYTQVGNAVPPLLAQKIAEVVSRFMETWSLNRSHQ